MSLRRIGPLALVVAIVGLLIGCGGTNHNPVIESLTATPAGPVRPGETIALNVTATDEDGDQLTFTWSASVGQLSSTSGANVIWTAPNEAAVCTVEVVCDDGNNGEATANKTLEAQAWQHTEVDGASPDSVHIPNPGTIEADFTMEEVIPAGALIDSALVTTDFDPAESLETEEFNVWVISPAGTAVPVYDGVNLLNLEVDDFLLTGTENQTAEGTWKLKIERLGQGVEGYADVCELEVYYRY